MEVSKVNFVSVPIKGFDHIVILLVIKHQKYYNNSH